MANWWEYHKVHVAAAAVLLLFILYFAVQDRSIPDTDYTVAWVSGQTLGNKAEKELSQMLSQYGQDLNHDGAVQVGIRQIQLDLGQVISGGGAEGQQEYGELLALNADLEVGQSGIFLTDDPASLQAYTGALLYRDGEHPDETAEDWENMVVSWEQDDVGTVYAGLRGCRKDSWAETWEQYRILWNALAADPNTT